MKFTMKYIYLKILTWLAQIRVERAVERTERANKRARYALDRYTDVLRKLETWNKKEE